VSTPETESGTVRVVVAPDKFKGSLSARQVADHLAIGLRRAVPTVAVTVCPIADGGDGTVEAVARSGFTVEYVTITDSIGRSRRAAFAVRGDTAVVELAEADGLRHLAAAERAPLTATSYGVGELIRAALDRGCRTVILGLGGSANTDGGAGMLRALGLRLHDRTGQELPPGGAALATVGTVDVAGLDPRIADTTFIVASDVDSPLLGPTGAARIYSPQKGATPDEVQLLESGLRRWAGVVAGIGRPGLADHPGAGAAGGVGFAALALLGAGIRPGIALVLDLVRFDKIVEGADLVVTGEGSLDEQSLNGKAPVGVAAAAAHHGVTTVAVVGRNALTPNVAAAADLDRVYALSDIEPDLAVCLSEAGRLVEQLAGRIAADYLPSDPSRAVPG
jgi:glycerate kinase